MNGSWHVCVGSILEPPILFLSRVELVLSIRTKNRKKLNLDEKKDISDISPLCFTASAAVSNQTYAQNLFLSSPSLEETKSV